MNDTVLLFTGVSVFGLMLVAIVFTVLEFRELGERRERRGSAQERKSTVN